jgi:hypothetical protein
VTVADADTASHETAMRGRGMHLVSREKVDQSTWRYMWSASPVAVTDVAPAPDPISPRETLRPVQHVDQRKASTLDGLADDLIGAYQATLREARALDGDLRAQISHVVAESARHASEQARLYHSEAVADRLKRFYDDLPDLLGKIFGVASAQAAKWAKGQLTAVLATGGLAALYGKLYAAYGLLAGGAAGAVVAFASFGEELLKHGSGIHLLAVGAYCGCGYLANQAQKDLDDARRSTDPAAEIITRTLNEPEREFFRAVGAAPPTRAALRATGPALATSMAVLIAIGCAIAAAIVFGGLLRIAANGAA